MLRLISAVKVEELERAAGALYSSALGGFCGVAPQAAEIIERKKASELVLQRILTIKVTPDVT
jgi:hypothetical protein